MQNIKVIIGASYGDEGKGLATDFFGAKAGKKHGTINVLTNGGPQRGHTVELADGRRHVFKHFGAAAFRGAATFFAQQFLVNPMEFCREYNELCEMDHAPETYMDSRCRFTTPWDMLVNQILQEKRGLHNSCGFGIWETVLRYDRGCGIPTDRFLSMSREDRLSFLIRLRDSYFVKRIRELGLAQTEGDSMCRPLNSGGLPGGLEDLFFSDTLLRRFEEDCETMRFLCPMRDEDYLRHFSGYLRVYSNHYYNKGYHTGIWSSTELEDFRREEQYQHIDVYILFLDNDKDSAQVSDTNRDFAESVRCLKDDSEK